ncbi:MAG: 23S rRNA pseudouridine(955/2504/2580) synthase [Proteobacteria bacterium]|nr:MAG: 23S rRNA pseudouridine(955/2504/2580) synthase [Pseudomonadota bacterium]
MGQVTKSVEFHTVTERECEQRVDNFLTTYLKGVPKTRLYKMIRKGEVRVNKGRVKPDYRLAMNDVVRIPPVSVQEKTQYKKPGHWQKTAIEQSVLFEDDALLVINKPSGFAVHGGSGLNYGVIEILRELRGEHAFIELVHRLDRDTSGCLMIAKKRSSLRWLHECLREDRIKKRYHALVDGIWPKRARCVEAPLKKNVLKSGERIVRVDREGKPAQTNYRILATGNRCSLIEAMPITGRTHQIRVHCQFAGHAIIGDDKYWEADSDLSGMAGPGKQPVRLMLHARQLTIPYPDARQSLEVVAPYPKDYENIKGAMLDGQSPELARC